MKKRIGILLVGAGFMLALIVAPPPRVVKAQNAAGVGFEYVEITTSTTTQIGLGSVQLHSIIVSGAGTSWTMQIFDNTSCATTAIFGATAVTVPSAGTVIPFDVQTNKGLCVKTIGASPGEITVLYR